MLRDHFPYAVVALLFGSLGANDITVFALIFILATLWIPIVNLLDREAENESNEGEFLPYDPGTGETITQIHEDK